MKMSLVYTYIHVFDLLKDEACHRLTTVLQFENYKRSSWSWVFFFEKCIPTCNTAL